jgi:hypothetical protein
VAAGPISRILLSHLELTSWWAESSVIRTMVCVAYRQSGYSPWVFKVCLEPRQSDTKWGDRILILSLGPLTDTSRTLRP